MSDTDLTPEEKAAYEAMQADDTPIEQPTEEARAEQPEASEQAEEQPTEEASTPADGEPEFKSQRGDDKPPEGFVPHQAMHAERMKRQELERKVAEFENWKKSIDEAKTREENPEPQYVDPLEDPEGFRKWAEHNSQAPQKSLQEMQEQQAQQRQLQQRVQEATRLEQEFAAKTPDYGDAVQALHNARVSELRNAGYADSQIQAQIQADAQSIFDAARAANINPAQLLYIRAREMGYNAAQPAAQPAATQAAEQMQARAAAQKQTQGLSSAGGGEQGGQMTAAQLADMSEAELAKIPQDVIAKAFGG